MNKETHKSQCKWTDKIKNALKSQMQKSVRVLHTLKLSTARQTRWCRLCVEEKEEEKEWNCTATREIKREISLVHRTEDCLWIIADANRAKTARHW